MSTAIEIGGASTIGKRERQEDCFMAYHMVEELPKKHQRFILSTDRNVCMGVLCDGMGGEGQGDFCARQAIQAYGETFAETGSFNTMWKERMFMSLYAANAAVHDFKESVHKKESHSGCTLVSAVISDDELHYVSVGDSYILLFRKDKSVGHYKEHQLNQRHIQGYKYTTSEDGEVHAEPISEEEEKDLKKGLKSVSSFIRSQLAQRLNLRITPELSFVKDNGVKHGADIAAILKTLETERNTEEETEEEE